MNTASNHSIYARWTANTYTVTFNRTNFINGEVVYFNPVTAKVCDSSEAVSTTGYKDGCMKWYAFLDDGSNAIDLILDHNTTAICHWTTTKGDTKPTAALAQLASDTTNWNSNIKSTVRLIEASEVAQISNNKNWNQYNNSSWYYLHTGNQTPYRGSKGTNSYAWLIDNTYDCETYGCNVRQDGNHGYWTNTVAANGYDWNVDYNGNLGVDEDIYQGLSGVRPVITVNKNLLQETKTVIYDNTYGELPTITRPGYTFKGWYTTGGLKVTSDTIVEFSSNHTLYAQWENLYEDGNVVYYDVTTGKSCTNYHVDNSITGYNGTTETKTTNNQNGCLKFYSFLSETTDYVNLFLDHDTTTYTCWNNSGGEWNTTNVNGPSTAEGNVLNDLYLDTQSWIGTNTPKNYSLNQTSATEGYANYTINYSGYKARLITAQEIADIVGASKSDTGFKFNESTAHRVNDYFYFDGFGTTALEWQIRTVGINTCGENEDSPCAKEVSEYGWLYDRSGTDCVTYGCYNNSDTNTAYWTATASTGDSAGAWRLYGGGKLHYNYVWAGGSVRPVIEVNKSNLK